MSPPPTPAVRWTVLWPLVLVSACRAPAQEPADLPGAADPAARGSLASPADPSPGPALAPALPDGAAGTGAGGLPAEGERPWLRGQLSARYRGRWRGGEKDHDLTSSISLDAGDPARDRWTYAFGGSAFADLDGLADPDEQLFGLADTYDHRLEGRIYHAFADLHGRGVIERVRLGRQLDYDTPELAWFDGVSLTASGAGERRLGAGLYGGIPVHAYESSPDGDLVAGAWAEARPWKEARARLDWMHVEDEYLARDHEQDLAGISLWQSLGRGVRLEGGYTMLDGDDRDVRAAATLMSTEGGLVLRASFYKLLETQRSQALETDPFFDSLQELFPFEQLRVMLSKTLGESLVLEGGVDLRRVDDEDDEGQFNRDFDRTFVTATLLEGLPWELEAAVTWDAYESDGTDTRVLGADLSRKFGQRSEASVGTYYGLYKYDLFQNQEREDVRTWYLRLRRGLSEDTRLDLSYEYEDDDLDDYHTLRAGTTWSF